MLTFNYRLQAEATGKTRLGRNVSFLIEDTFPATLDAAHDSLVDAKIINTVANGDFTEESLSDLLASALEAYCLRYAIVPHSVELTRYLVDTDDIDVRVSFSNQTLTSQTTLGDSSIFAYRLVDAAVPDAPLDVQATERDGALVVGWKTSGHVHGTRIYDGERTLLASLSAGAYEWIDISATATDRLYTYEVVTYNALQESAPVRVSARLQGELVVEQPGEGIDETRLRQLPKEGFMPLFQSGIGDGDDLLVRFDESDNREEEFSYTLQLKGYTHEVIAVYPKRLFRYRISVHDENGQGVGTANWRVGIIDGAGELDTDGSGKKNVRLNLASEVAHLAEDMTYSIELEDDSGAIEYVTEVTADSTYLVFSSKAQATEERLLKRATSGVLLERTERLRVAADKQRRIEAEIPNPANDPAFADKDIVDWMLVINSDNPNVALEQTGDPIDYGSSRATLTVHLRARVLNPTQTAWRPLVRSGYYYTNQREHFFFGGSDVKKRMLHLADLYAVDFTYRVEVEHTRDAVSTWYTLESSASVRSDGQIYPMDTAKLNERIEQRLALEDIVIEEGDGIAYRLIADPPDAVELTVGRVESEQEEGVLYAKSLREVYDETGGSDVFGLDANDSLLLEPRPLPGSPVIAQDATGAELKQVFFYDELGQATLDFSEYVVANDFNELHLSYFDIDPSTLVVERYIIPPPAADGRQHKGGWEATDAFVLASGIIHLYPEFAPGTEYRVSYRLLRSFIAQPEADDAVRLTFHGAIPNEDGHIRVWYETQRERVLDMDVNPLRTRGGEGFLYLSDTKPVPASMELHLTPAVMYTEHGEETTFRLYLSDKWGNPVAGEPVGFRASEGELTQIHPVTDRDGMAAVRYVAPDIPKTVTITAFANEAVVSASGTIEVRKATAPSRITVETDHATVYPEVNEVTVTAHVYGKDQEPVEDARVDFQIPYSDNESATAQTDAFGRASASFNVLSIPPKGFVPVTVTVPALELKEETAVRILGFRDYDHDRFVDSNNLIDIYDHEAARKNLGVFVGDDEPNNAEENDIWFDRAGVLIQSYTLDTE